jgi:hypothetical protein
LQAGWQKTEARWRLLLGPGWEIDVTASLDWPTDEEIREVATNAEIPFWAVADEIARQYHRISRALSAHQLGSEDLNWCGFAQWSSETVGSALRLGNNSEFLQILGRRCHVPMAAEPLFRLFVPLLLGRSYDIGLSVANRSIFAEMASFHTCILSGAEEPTILRLILPELLVNLGQEGQDLLRAGGYHSLLANLGPGGQDLLRTAHNLLSSARFASGELRSELILGANIALSAYEQKRVQPALEYVFYRFPRWVLQVFWRIPYYFATNRLLNRFDFYLRPHQCQTPVVRWLEELWVRAYSKTLWLKTAIDTVALGRPLTLPHGHAGHLLRPAAEFKTREVADLVRRYGPADPTKLKGVSNWLDYWERMQFIVTYFMVYQQVRKMFDEPRFKHE